MYLENALSVEKSNRNNCLYQSHSTKEIYQLYHSPWQINCQKKLKKNIYFQLKDQFAEIIMLFINFKSLSSVKIPSLV